MKVNYFDGDFNCRGEEIDFNGISCAIVAAGFDKLDSDSPTPSLEFQLGNNNIDNLARLQSGYYIILAWIAANGPRPVPLQSFTR